MKILFVGDIVGEPGRRVILKRLHKLIAQHHIDVVIGNGENAAGGFGITPDIAHELFDLGIAVITLGNHAWDKKEAVDFIHKDSRILRPANYPEGVPGRGAMVFETAAGETLGILQLMGRVFMPILDCPFRVAEREVASLKERTPAIIVDMHAETTSEKMAMGHFLDGKVSAVVGTHTHVQTADNQILPKGTAYLTDIGMTGPVNSVIGMKADIVIQKFLLQTPRRFEVASGPATLCAAVIDLDTAHRKSSRYSANTDTRIGIGLLSTVLSHILTVTELTSQVRMALEGQFPVVWVEGEISNLRRPSSGHQYFTLKDQTSQIRVVLFRGVAHLLPFLLEEGLEVIVRGHVTVYEARGEYQLILEAVEPKGVGALQLAFEQLKKKLEDEGLFQQSRKRPLPSFPKKVGVITSRHGAALHDIMSILYRRCPMIPILIHPVLVQGEGAAQQIASAIRMVNQMKDVDVLIVGRGGGGWEDLWSFNEEVVVRAIAESSIPVVSAIGHETDITLADLAADLRAPTPSAAAEIVAPDSGTLDLQVRQLLKRLLKSMQNIVERYRRRVEFAQQAIPDPVFWLYRYGQQVDDLDARLYLVINECHQKFRLQLSSLQSRVLTQSPIHQIHGCRQLIPQLCIRMLQGQRSLLTHKRYQAEVNMTLLQTMSPLTVLSRGYSIVENVEKDKIVNTIKDVAIGDHLRARLHDGKVLCYVEEVYDET